VVVTTTEVVEITALFTCAQGVAVVIAFREAEVFGEAVAGSRPVDFLNVEKVDPITAAPVASAMRLVFAPTRGVFVTGDAVEVALELFVCAFVDMCNLTRTFVNVAGTNVFDES
jgi:hypothetical protein